MNEIKDYVSEDAKSAFVAKGVASVLKCAAVLSTSRQWSFKQNVDTCEAHYKALLQKWVEKIN